MSRNPSTKIFSYSAGVPVLENSLLDSGDYNAALSDVAADFNNPLPIEMGGTGASTQESALPNIGAVSTFYISTLFAGAIGTFASETPPPGWLIANGGAVSREVYKTLFLRYGTRFGGGDGSSTFNLPDLRGVFLRGLDSGRGLDVSRSAGTEQSDENESHTHGGSTASSGSHTHSSERFALVTGPSPPVSLIIGSWGGGSGAGQSVGTSATTAVGPHTHDITIDAAGSEFRPKNTAVLCCVKT